MSTNYPHIETIPSSLTVGKAEKGPPRENSNFLDGRKTSSIRVFKEFNQEVSYFKRS